MICAEKQRTVYKLSLLTTLNYVRDSDKVSCRSYCVLKIKNICELGEGNIFQLLVRMRKRQEFYGHYSQV